MAPRHTQPLRMPQCCYLNAFPEGRGPQVTDPQTSRPGRDLGGVLIRTLISCLNLFSELPARACPARDSVMLVNKPSRLFPPRKTFSTAPLLRAAVQMGEVGPVSPS